MYDSRTFFIVYIQICIGEIEFFQFDDFLEYYSAAIHKPNEQITSQENHPQIKSNL